MTTKTTSTSTNGSYQVILDSCSAGRRDDVVAVLWKRAGLSLKQSKELISSGRAVVLDNVDWKTAKLMSSSLMRAGGNVEMIDKGSR